MKKNNFKKNFIWNTIGCLTAAITSLFYSIVLTRFCDLNETGLYTIAFAIACNTVTLASFGGRTYQVTDTKNEISNFSYIFARYITITITFFGIILYLLFKWYSLYKTVVILLVCLFKFLEELSDVYYGILQKDNKLYKVGQFQFFKAIVNIIMFILIMVLTQNLIYAFSTLLIINLIYFIFFERKAARECENWKFNIKKDELKKYFLANIYICILTFLTTYIINCPKYAIDEFLTSSDQAIFGIIVMPATVMLLVGNFLLNPIIVTIADYYNNNKIKQITKLIIKIFIITISIGILGIIICYFIGIPLLNFIYSINLSKYKLSLIIIIIGSVFYAITASISSILIAMRRIKSQVIGNILVILFSIIICQVLVTNYKIYGAALTYTILIFIRFIIYLLVLIRTLTKKV